MIRLLAWEFPYAAGVAIKKEKEKKKKKKICPTPILKSNLEVPTCDALVKDLTAAAPFAVEVQV